MEIAYFVWFCLLVCFVVVVVVVCCFVLFCFVLFCFVLFCFVLFCFVLFCFVLSVPLWYLAVTSCARRQPADADAPPAPPPPPPPPPPNPTFDAKSRQPTLKTEEKKTPAFEKNFLVPTSKHLPLRPVKTHSI